MPFDLRNELRGKGKTSGESSKALLYSCIGIVNSNISLLRSIINEAAAASPIEPLINMGQGFL